MTTYILDAESVAMVGTRTVTDHCHTVLDAITDAVVANQVIFPPEVGKEARRWADQNHEPWVYALAAACKISSVPYTFVLEVQAICEGLADMEAVYSGQVEPSVSYVAGLALQWRPSGVVVVTEEIEDLPERMALGSACQKIDVPILSLAQFVGNLPGCSSGMIV